MATRKWSWDTASLEQKKLFVRVLKEDGHSDRVIGAFFRKSKDAIVGFRHRQLPELTFGQKAIKPRVDPERFEQIIANLISNALKFTPEGGKISLGGRRQNGLVEVYVADSGKGIPPKEMSRLFQLETSPTNGAPVAVACSASR